MIQDLLTYAFDTVGNLTGDEAVTLGAEAAVVIWLTIMFASLYRTPRPKAPRSREHRMKGLGH